MPQALLADLQQFMRQPQEGDEAFNALALRLFEHQFRHNAAYQRYCRFVGKTPRLLTRWQDIPSVPIDAFKDLTLSCVAPDQCERVFMTSGTTRAERRGRNYHPHLQVYDLSMRLYFSQRFMRGTPRMRMGILFPTEQMMPNSSLAHYLALALEHFGDAGSRYFVSPGGVELDALCQALAQAQHDHTPFALLGASYSFVHVMDALGERGLRFQLPAGSRLFDTGGFKGQSRTMQAAEFYDLLHHCFGLPPQHCTNMYGMTELSSQIYDNGNATLPAVKSGPHWTRTRVLDPVTGQEMLDGEEGILAHTDLANFNSVCAILTEDLGVRVPGGFLLLGRADGAAAKGCSLAMEAFLQAAQ